MSADQAERAQQLDDRIGPKLAAAGKVVLVTLGSIVAVLFASLIISIIQFQARLSEARTQSGSITLESIQLLSDYQDHLTRGYREVRQRAERLPDLQIKYTAQLDSTSKFASSACRVLDPEQASDCIVRFLELIGANHVGLVLAKYAREASEEPGIKALADQLKELAKNSKLHEFQRDYQTTQQQIEAGCQNLLQLTSARPEQMSLLGVSPELRMTIRFQCNNWTTAEVKEEQSATIPAPPRTQAQEQSSTPSGQQAEVAPALQKASTDAQQQSVAAALQQVGPRTFMLADQEQSSTQPSAPTGSQAPGGDSSSRDAAPGAKNQRLDVSGVNRILLSELVFHYRFYSWLTSDLGTLREIILSPPEFITILLVIATGILGSFMFHSYTMFLAGSSAGYPTMSAIALRGTLSVMAALVIYILARTGVVAVTESAGRASGSPIGPFAIAFLSVTAGLLAERALERIREAGNDVFTGRRSKASTDSSLDPGVEPPPSNENVHNASDTNATGKNFAAARTAVLVLAVMLLSAGELFAQGAVLRPLERIAQAPQFGLRCRTPQNICNLSQPARVGAPCICKTGTGEPAEGRVVQ
jgi:hypothetical protein